MPEKRFGEAGAVWRRSCVGQGHCVEMSVVDGGARVLMRNSTVPETVLTLDADQWTNFIDAIKTGGSPISR